MDVSRIGPVSLNKINWRSLTAKEIIKYEQQGVDVPLQYLNWAQNFISSVYSDDKTTYEMAKSTPDRTTSTTSTPEVAESEETTEGTTTGSTEETTSTDETQESEENKNAAQLKREQLQDDGVSLQNQAKIFTEDSKTASKESIISSILMKSIESQSTNEIEILENYMQELLSKAETTQSELKNEITSINNDNSDKTTFARINQLEQELQKYGIEGQSRAASSLGRFNEFDSGLNSQTGVITNANDFGTETTQIGTEVIQRKKNGIIQIILDFVIGRRAISAGENAINRSAQASGIQSQSLSTNSANLSQATSYQGEIESKTGVQAVPVQDTDNQSTEDATKTEQEQNEDKNKVIVDKTEKEDEKAVKTAQNDGTDTTDRLSTNIDEILKRKLRRGQPIES